MSQTKQMMISQAAKLRTQLPRLVLVSLFALYALFASVAPGTPRTMAAPGAATSVIPIKTTTAPATPIDDPDPCASLTPAALQQVIDVIAQSRTKAESDVAANGVNGIYAAATHHNLAYLNEAHDIMIALQSFLQSEGIDSPYVTNASGASNVHGYVREVVVPLHHARHWATISATHHLSTDARDSYELTSQALDLAEALGAQAGRCYMNVYLQ
jgi:hypothetical protein